jgi:hypothetical protein
MSSKSTVNRRLEVARDEIYWRRNILTMRDVHMATRDRVFLHVEDSGAMVHSNDGTVTLTVQIAIEKYLRGGTRVASPVKLNIPWVSST